MSGPSIYLTLPPLSRFNFPPDSLPRFVPPSSDDFTVKSPIAINPTLYNAALDIKVPITISLCYVVTVLALNVYNNRNGNKRWPISNTRIFKRLVLLHNAALVVYSAATFAAMCRAVSHTWPGLNQGDGLVKAVDAMCRLHGPRGLGDAVGFNETLHIWETKNERIRVGANSTPDASDVGRLWNEGLAFWGWLFYLSKFYELLDTLVILAKGKRSPFLQTYHHTGIMFTVWAGIRYMSPPIWLAVAVNSGIHTFMYTYFFFAEMGVKIPLQLKRFLTTLQIVQLVFGASYAAAHLFIKYDIPIQTAYKVYHPLKAMASTVSSTASAMAASPSASLIPFFKRMLLRAAGDEGLAENIRDRQGHLVMPGVQQAIEHAQERFQEETKYRTEYTTIDCIDTQGQLWAILINLFYLLPLIWLFIRFFLRAYGQRMSNPSPRRTKGHAASQSRQDATKGVRKSFDQISKTAERAVSGGIDHMDAEAVKKDLKALKAGTYNNAKNAARRVSDRVDSFERRAGDAKDRLAEALTSSKHATPSKGDASDAIHEFAESVKNKDHLDIPKAGSSNEDETGDSDVDGGAGSEASPNQATASQGSPAAKKKKKHKKKKSMAPNSDASAGQQGSGAKSMRESDFSLIDGE